MKPPTFFLSSTIYDFKDLRSALKYYLEQQGCRVLASEFNDFSKPLDTHSYEACLKSISQADWFILLIGARVGGWYDAANRVSITQREYREAYKLHSEGRIKLLSFVRGDVWRMKEDRKELARYLETLGLDPGAKEKIVNHPSKAASDAEFIAGFIEEVGRNRETQAAQKTGGPLPTGNWIHVFEHFRDIIDAVQIQPFMAVPVEEAALRRLLRTELVEFHRKCLARSSSGTPTSPYAAVAAFHTAHKVRGWHGENRHMTVDTELFENVCAFVPHLLNLRLHSQIVDRAIESSTFLEFDPGSSKLVETEAYKALLRLSEEIRTFGMARSGDHLKFFFETSPRMMPNRGPTFTVETFKLVAILHVMDRWCNIVALTAAIVRHLDGKPFVWPTLRPRSMLAGADETKDEVSDAEIEEILAR